MDTEERVAVQVYSFGGVKSGNYFVGEPTGRTEVELRVNIHFKNGNLADKDEVTGEILY